MDLVESRAGCINTIVQRTLLNELFVRRSLRLRQKLKTEGLSTQLIEESGEFFNFCSVRLGDSPDEPMTIIKTQTIH